MKTKMNTTAIVSNIGAIVTPPTHKGQRLSIFGEFLANVYANRNKKFFVLWSGKDERIVAKLTKDVFGQKGWQLAYEIRSKFSGRFIASKKTSIVAWKRYNYNATSNNGGSTYIELSENINEQYERFAQEVLNG